MTAAAAETDAAVNFWTPETAYQSRGDLFHILLEVRNSVRIKNTVRSAQKRGGLPNSQPFFLMHIHTALTFNRME
jgi:hypothetical protein